MIFSIGDASLRGNCFAGLDETGVLSIYRGHPDELFVEPIWSSGPSPQNEYHGSFFHR